MNSYERNTGMVVCIIGVIVVGAILVGAFSYFGPAWSWGPTDTVYYSFDSLVGSASGTVNLDIDIEAGSVKIDFEDNTTLLYRVDVGVSNRTVQETGAPSVSFSSNTITLDYTALEANVTLGSGLNYTLNVVAGAGLIDCDVIHGAHVGDVSLTTTTGSIEFLMGSGVSVFGSPDFAFESTAGLVDLIINLPVGIGGSIEGAVAFGTVDIDAPGWTEVTSNHYESSDYDTADQKITVVAQSNTGTIEAHIS
ncbi:MAG: hypothetical protein JSW05_10955 [Candidatus Thorarchaeota archaeon]|nr:MAG: hypothetical protein JSW05_10955 [Candidatus Thorarchaeota archaeon]